MLGEDNYHRDYTYGVQTTRGIINGSESYPIRSVRSEKYKFILNLNYDEKFYNILTAEDSIRPSFLRGKKYLQWKYISHGLIMPKLKSN